MERFVDLNKEFIGKSATLDALREGPRILLAYLQVETEDEDCLGNEPVYSGNSLVGITTGGGYGFAVGKSLAFAYLEPKLVQEDAAFEILLRGERRGARIIAQPVWDPRNERLRG
jgi:dimethylglycine dehydrogenase